MSLTIVLSVGIDPWLFESQRTAWHSAGYFVTAVYQLDQSIDLFASNDFDVVLLGSSLTDEHMDHITSMIRARGSRIPIIRMSDVFLVAGIHIPTFRWESGMLMNVISERMSTPADTALPKVA